MLYGLDCSLQCDYVKPHGALCSLLFADAILVARACERQKERETREWTGICLNCHLL